MQTARDYLVKANLAKPGRGKFSNEAKEHLLQAIEDGHKFSDWDENGRISVNTSEKRKFEKRMDSDPVKREVKLDKFVRYREETQIVFTHPKSGQVVVLDSLETKPIWALEKIRPPSWLEGYSWELR